MGNIQIREKLFVAFTRADYNRWLQGFSILQGLVGGNGGEH